MTADDLIRLNQLVTDRGYIYVDPDDMRFLLGLLEQVARTAGRHYDPGSYYMDGEIDAIAILDTITGENHLRVGPGLQGIVQPDYSGFMTPPIGPVPEGPDGGLRY